MNDVVVIASRSLLGLFGLWIAVYYLWPDFRHDSFRDDLFSLRDEMFLYAAQGKISFEHPAYTMLRTRINRLLRHGHDFTLTRMFLVIFTHNAEKHESLTRWEEAVEELPVEVQVAMKEFNLRVAIFVLQHVVYYSFFRYILVRPLMALIEIRRIMQSPKVVSGVEKLESETLEREGYFADQTAAA